MQNNVLKDSKIKNDAVASNKEYNVKKELMVGDLMRSTAVACREDTPAIEVAQIMVVHRIRYCFVLNSHDELIGVIAARSLQSAAGSKLENTVARDVMLPTVFTTKRDTTIRQAVNEMYRNRVQHLVVVSDYPNLAALGIIGATDILKHIATH